MMADLDFAFELADIADAITMDRFHVGGLITETKADMSPVTEVDRAVESAIGQHIRSHRRADSIIGEEYGGETLEVAAGSSTLSTEPPTSSTVTPGGPPSSYLRSTARLRSLLDHSRRVIEGLGLHEAMDRLTMEYPSTCQ